jgi:hypothetical protein
MGQEIQYRVHNSPPLVSMFSQTNPLPLSPVIFLEDPL